MSDVCRTESDQLRAQRESLTDRDSSKNQLRAAALERTGTEEQPRVSSMDRDLSDRIRERAYEIWAATGYRHGEAERHWFAAEQEILAGSSLDAHVAHAATKANKRRGPAKRPKESLRQ